MCNYVATHVCLCNLCATMFHLLLKYDGFIFLNAMSKFHKILLQSYIDHYIIYAPMVKICVIYNSSQRIFDFSFKLHISC